MWAHGPRPLGRPSHLLVNHVLMARSRRPLVLCHQPHALLARPVHGRRLETKYAVTAPPVRIHLLREQVPASNVYHAPPDNGL